MHLSKNKRLQCHLYEYGVNLTEFVTKLSKRIQRTFLPALSCTIYIQNLYVRIRGLKRKYYGSVRMWARERVFGRAFQSLGLILNFRRNKDWCLMMSAIKVTGKTGTTKHFLFIFIQMSFLFKFIQKISFFRVFMTIFGTSGNRIQNPNPTAFRAIFFLLNSGSVRVKASTEIIRSGWG